MVSIYRFILPLGPHPSQSDQEAGHLIPPPLPLSDQHRVEILGYLGKGGRREKGEKEGIQLQTLVEGGYSLGPGKLLLTGQKVLRLWEISLFEPHTFGYLMSTAKSASTYL